MSKLVSSPSTSIVADLEQVAKVVLFPGDPLRAKSVADKYLENAVCFNTVRNMLGFTGTYKGRKISVMGSGMGVPSATLYAHELFSFFGVEAIIRMGTAGGVSPDCPVRSLVIAMTASTNSNYAMQYCFPGQLSPQADFALLRTAVEVAEAKAVNVKVGSVFTSDVFYNMYPDAASKYNEMGILAVEMETAGLYWEAMASKKRALSILSISDNMATGDSLPAEDRQESFTQMMETALETAWSVAE